MNTIDRFDGPDRWLSNFYSHFAILYEGISYTSVEAAYQAAKTLSPKTRLEISLLSPSQAKKKGRAIRLREDWEDVKLSIMEQLLRLKFAQYDLRNKLIETGDAELIEGNWWGDTYWGVCNGVGLNYLGKLLMKIRQEMLSGTF